MAAPNGIETKNLNAKNLVSHSNKPNSLNLRWFVSPILPSNL